MKINLTNIDKINAELDKTQFRCSVNMITHYELLDLAEEARERLKNLFPMIFWSGAKFVYCPKGPWANAYKYGQGATTVTLTISSSGAAFLTKIERTKVYSKKP